MNSARERIAALRGWLVEAEGQTGWQRALWFAAIWVAGVVTLTVVAYGIRALIVP
ncbi:DUF2474 family protein [Polycladidibacter hongkongensis]|uniref:DUF2474 family protein n=1 Tax=Polycladidibacter hongkongensis TaxID=1647556 RepID=UPI0009E7C56E|nr:DUF2474 family protein [Pseudovibrio hongkongensis]